MNGWRDGWRDGSKRVLDFLFSFQRFFLGNLLVHLTFLSLVEGFCAYSSSSGRHLVASQILNGFMSSKNSPPSSKPVETFEEQFAYLLSQHQSNGSKGDKKGKEKSRSCKADESTKGSISHFPIHKRRSFIDKSVLEFANFSKTLPKLSHPTDPMTVSQTLEASEEHIASPKARPLGLHQTSSVDSPKIQSEAVAVESGMYIIKDVPPTDLVPSRPPEKGEGTIPSFPKPPKSSIGLPKVHQERTLPQNDEKETSKSESSVVFN